MQDDKCKRKAAKVLQILSLNDRAQQTLVQDEILRTIVVLLMEPAQNANSNCNWSTKHSLLRCLVHLSKSSKLFITWEKEREKKEVL